MTTYIAPTTTNQGNAKLSSINCSNYSCIIGGLATIFGCISACIGVGV